MTDHAWDDVPSKTNWIIKEEESAWRRLGSTARWMRMAGQGTMNASAADRADWGEERTSANDG